MFFRLFRMLLLLLLTFIAKAQEQIYFDQYSTQNGLSDNFVTSVVQDDRGYVWIATRYGLNRFDGQNIKIFTNENYSKLPRNDINCLALDSAHRLMLGSYGGVLLRYNQTNDDFDNLSIHDVYESDYASIISFNQHARYALSMDGLYTYNPRVDSFINTHKNFVTSPNPHLSCLCIDSKQRFWIGSNSHLQLFDKSGLHLKDFSLKKGQNIGISDLFALSDTSIVVCTYSEGLWNIHIAENISDCSITPIATPFNDATCMFRDSKKRVWIGTREHGLWFIDASGKFVPIQSYQTKNSNLKTINCIFEDRNKILWVGTQGTGLWFYNRSFKNRVMFSKNSGFPSSIVSAFEQDQNDNLWVGTDGEGVYILSPNFSQREHLQQKTGLPSNCVLQIFNDHISNFWLATWGGGICKIDLQSRAISSWTSENSQLPLNNCKSVCVSSLGQLWAGTHGEGLSVFDAAKRVWITSKNSQQPAFYLPPYPWINQIIEGHKNVFWVANLRAVWRFDNFKATKILADTDGKPHVNPLLVNAVATNNRDLVLVVTNQGVYSISQLNNAISHLDFLPVGKYVALEFDSHNRCWFSGSNGIVCANLETKKFKKVSLPDECYRGNYFTPRASFVDKTGRIYFGAVDGFLSFHPDSLWQDSTIENLLFSNLYVDANPIMPGSAILPQDLWCTKQIALQYDQTNIQVGFDVIHTASRDDILCAYMLEGLNKKWIPLNTKREISFSQILPGNYTLHVKAWRNNYSNNGKQISLSILVSHPWWATWWFKILILMLALGFVILFYYIRFRSIVARNILLEEMVHQRTHELVSANQEIVTQNLNLSQKQLIIQTTNSELQRTLETKNRLISIIAHDLKNPLGAIVGLLDMLHLRYDDYDDVKRKRFIDNALISSTRLQDEMTKLLEWASAQMHTMVYTPQNTNLQSIIDETIAFLTETAALKNIDIHVSYCTKSFAFVDGRMISTVVRNILSNAIKFTPNQGTIRVETSMLDDTIFIAITDSGVGMTPEQLASIFKPDSFTSTYGTNNEKGTGLGLKICEEFVTKNKGSIVVESQINKGTSFKISLPLAQNN